VDHFSSRVRLRESLAIRESEEAVRRHRRQHDLYKVAAFCIRGALTGIAGGIFAQWYSYNQPGQRVRISERAGFPMAVIGRNRHG